MLVPVDKVVLAALVAALVPWLAEVPAAWAASAWNSAPTKACTALPDASKLDAVLLVLLAVLAEVEVVADAAVVGPSVLDDEVVMSNCASVC
ncbi:hypothetical protein RA280_05215 [Cupriavidus sp. CV2]|uniref:hypothetical protein n=1 Tax=Cupriavidus ulmosensis TaxID=3065913 RepID=UPI00296B57B4|nr:hypothetical protein [Cupriavidus sp. CV2]MDW3681153.1 hypothetical protein [Cupriavidus sp. CV2]